MSTQLGLQDPLVDLLLQFPSPQEFSTQQKANYKFAVRGPLHEEACVRDCQVLQTWKGAAANPDGRDGQRGQGQQPQRWKPDLFGVGKVQALLWLPASIIWLRDSNTQGPQTRALKREAAEVFLQIQAPSEAQREDHKLRAARGHQLIAVESGDLGCAQCGATGVAATAATGAAAAIAAACRQGPAALHPGSLVW
eukprot:CAMPEP_0202339290 /NCGR_PEP_ID=MMETSP1126-20121109/1217_1 /ASSEMBLY_ACC=CAM_ASM_000457 /TAXON_ID=3047 /ORGANISM="Dunaliella tertiolecta, Strain CCMP1320" /LENGTH=194 /DNA_ID=CAMNT_0048929823 /DNA_START=1540 /DNA_END=2122 /DNA_ORIENTATION=-